MPGRPRRRAGRQLRGGRLSKGSSDALVGLAKLAGGPLSNDPGRRGRLASGGYLGPAVATGAIGLATAVWQVAILHAAG